MDTTNPIDLRTPLLDGGVASVKFFNGRLVTSSDMGREQDARRLSDHRVAQAIGCGVIRGLRVSKFQDSVVAIESGSAVASDGQVLRLANDTKVSLVALPESAAPTNSVGFQNCVQIGRRFQKRPAEGYHALVLSPASAEVGKVRVVGTDLGQLGSNTDTNVDGVQLRLVAIPGSKLPGTPTENVAARNLIAHMFFRSTELPQPGVDDQTENGLLSELLKQGLENPLGLQPQDVPLALVHLNVAGVIDLLDMWALRRRIHLPERIWPELESVHPGTASAQEWGPFLGADLEPRGEAMLLQFQDQLADWKSSNVTMKSEMVATSPSFRQVFPILPPVGFLPVDFPNLGTALAPAVDAKIDSANLPEVETFAAAKIVRDALALPAYSRDASSLRVMRIKGLPWLLFVRDVIGERTARETSYDMSVLNQDGWWKPREVPQNVQAVVDKLNERTQSFDKFGHAWGVEVNPGSGLGNNVQEALDRIANAVRTDHSGFLHVLTPSNYLFVLDSLKFGADLNLFFEAGTYHFESLRRLVGNTYNHLRIQGAGAGTVFCCHSKQAFQIIDFATCTILDVKFQGQGGCHCQGYYPGYYYPGSEYPGSYYPGSYDCSVPGSSYDPFQHDSFVKSTDSDDSNGSQQPVILKIPRKRYSEQNLKLLASVIYSWRHANTVDLKTIYVLDVLVNDARGCGEIDKTTAKRLSNSLKKIKKGGPVDPKGWEDFDDLVQLANSGIILTDAILKDEKANSGEMLEEVNPHRGWAGALRLDNIGEIHLERVWAWSPGSTEKDYNGIAVYNPGIGVNDPQPLHRVRIRDCWIQSGTQQVGILVVNGGIVDFDGNLVQCGISWGCVPTTRKIFHLSYLIAKYLAKLVLESQTEIPSHTGPITHVDATAAKNALSQKIVDEKDVSRLVDRPVRDAITGTNIAAHPEWIDWIPEAGRLEWARSHMGSDPNSPRLLWPMHRLIRAAIANFPTSDPKETFLANLARNCWNGLYHDSAHTERGVIIGGQILSHLRANGNTISGAAIGLAVALSRHQTDKNTPPLSVENAIIRDNDITVPNLPGHVGQRAAIFVGNVDRLDLSGNTLRAATQTWMEPVEGVRIWGSLGRFVRLDGNALEGFETAFKLHPVFPGGTGGSEEFARTGKVLWKIHENLLGNGAVTIDLDSSYSLAFRQEDNLS